MLGKLPGTNKEEGNAIPSLSGNYSQNSADSKWVSDQTNIGSIIGSLNPDEKLTKLEGRY